MQELFSFFQNSANFNSVISEGGKCLSYEDFFMKVESLSQFLRQKFSPQTKLTIIAQPSIEWLIWDFACLKSGIITIPMFANASNETLKFQIEESRPHIIVAQNITVLQKIQAIISHNFNNVFLIEKCTGYQTYENATVEVHILLKPSFSNAIATIIYTSGTTGNPKGVILTYSNFCSQIKDIQSSFNTINEKDVAISILPLAHVFQRTITYFYFSKGVNIHIINDVSNIVKHIANIHPSLITAVPRVLEKVYLSIQTKIEERPKFIKFLLLQLFKKASQKTIKNPIIKLILETLLFKKFRNIFGNNLKMIVCGGAKLNKNEELFFYNAKLPVFQGYGTTECSPVISSNSPHFHKLFTTGRPFSSVEVKITENEEILIRGDSVFTGYFNQSPLNPDDFFSTGDKGMIDKEGFLTVTGRIKEQCKTAYGKFVDMPALESLINHIPSVENCCIVAEGRPFVSAIIFTQLTNTDSIQQKIDEINSKLDHHTQIHKFITSQEKPTPENNIITPSMKIRRNLIYLKYLSQIEDIYKKA